MAKIKFELEAEVRQTVGRGASRRLRHTDRIPAVVYGAGESAVSLTLDHKKVYHALANEAFYSRILTLKTGKETEQVILKALQRHPARPRIQHIDFLRVKADQKLQMHVPLHFLGEDKSPAIKEGGVFSHLMSDVEVSCFPADLPEYIEVDVSNLMMDETIHLSQLNLPKGTELVAFSHGIEGHDHPVVTIHIPRIIEEEPVVAAPAEGELAEGAVPAEGEEKPAAGAEGEKKE